MINLTRWLQLLLVSFLLISTTGFSQISGNKSKKDLITTAKEIIKEVKTCALITIDNEGIARARTMDHFPPEDELTIWFGTNSNSRKVDQIKNNPLITLYFLDNDESGYVIIHGNATLIVDKISKDKYWKKEWEAFYPNKSENYLLIKVVPKWMEILSPPRGIYNDPVTWQPPVVTFDSIQ